MGLKRRLKCQTLPGLVKAGLRKRKVTLKDEYPLSTRQWGQSFPGRGSSL